MKKDVERFVYNLRLSAEVQVVEMVYRNCSFSNLSLLSSLFLWAHKVVITGKHYKNSQHDCESLLPGNEFAKILLRFAHDFRSSAPLCGSLHAFIILFCLSVTTAVCLSAWLSSASHRYCFHHLLIEPHRFCSVRPTTWRNPDELILNEAMISSILSRGKKTAAIVMRWQYVLVHCAFEWAQILLHTRRSTWF